MKNNNKGFASTFILFSLLVLFLIVMSIMLFTMNNSSVLNSGLKSKLVNDIELNEQNLNKVTVTLDANGGEIASDSGWDVITNQDNLVSASKKVRYNNIYGSLPTTTRNGYVFRGWYNAISLGDISIYDNNNSPSNGKYIEYNITPGVTYTITMDNVVLKAGSTTKFSVSIFDLTTNQQLEIAEGNVGSANTIKLECPEVDDPTDKIRIKLFAGVNGQTAGKSLEFKNVKIGTMDTTTASEVTQDTKMTYGDNHVLYAIWGVPVKAVASGGSIISTSGWTGTGEFATKIVNQGEGYGTLPSMANRNTAALQAYTLKGWKTIPNGYKDLDYLEAPGGYFIDTGYTLNNNSIVEIRYTSNMRNKAIFGSIDRAAGKSYALVDTSTSNEKMYVYYGSSYQMFDNDITFGYENNNVDNVRIWQYTSKAIHVSSTKLGPNIDLSTSAAFTSDKVLLFGVYRPDIPDNPIRAPGGSRIYYFREYNHSDTYKSLIHYYVPCQREIDGANGMYDLVTDKFFVLANSTGQSNNSDHSNDVVGSTIMGNNKAHTLYAMW